VKLAARIGLLVGLCVTIALIARIGGAAILQLLLRARWWLPWLIPLHALPLLLDAAGWRALLASICKIRTLFWIAALREGINRLLPVANIGGELVGIQLLIRQGVDAPIATASVVVETLLTLVSQCIFAAIGLACLIQIAGRTPLTLDVLLSLSLSVLVILGFGALLKHGSAFERIERAAARLLANFSRDSFRFNGKSLDDCIRDLLASPRRLTVAALWQLSGLLVGCTETWLILRWLGHPVPAGAAIALESLTQTARNIFFMIPAGLGIQEVGLIGLGSIIGIDAETSISLSLAKRLREISFSLPALAAWHLWEGRQSPARLRDSTEP
jgi:putative membrane protein